MMIKHEAGLTKVARWTREGSVVPVISLSLWEGNQKPFAWGSIGHATIEDTEDFAMCLLDAVATYKRHEKELDAIKE